MRYLEGVYGELLLDIRRRTGCSVHIIHLTWGPRIQRDKRLRFFEGKGIKYSSCNVRCFNSLPWKILGVIVSLLFIPTQLHPTYRSSIIITRGMVPTLLYNILSLMSLVKGRHFFDTDGMPVLEAIESGRFKQSGFVSRIMMLSENHAVKKAEAVIIRRFMAAKYFREKLPQLDPSKFVVNRHKVGDEWFYCENNLRWGGSACRFGRFFLYIGGWGYKYDIKTCLSILKILNQVDDGLKLLCLTTSASDFRSYYRLPMDVRNVQVCSFPRRQIPEIASRAIFAVSPILPSAAMRFASAIKIQEYRALGLPILTSGVAHDDEFLTIPGFDLEIPFTSKYMEENRQCLIDWYTSLLIKDSGYRVKVSSGLKESYTDLFNEDFMLKLRSEPLS